MLTSLCRAARGDPAGPAASASRTAAPSSLPARRPTGASSSAGGGRVAYGAPERAHRGRPGGRGPAARPSRVLPGRLRAQHHARVGRPDRRLPQPYPAAGQPARRADPLRLRLHGQRRRASTSPGGRSRRWRRPARTALTRCRSWTRARAPGSPDRSPGSAARRSACPSRGGCHRAASEPTRSRGRSAAPHASGCIWAADAPHCAFAHRVRPDCGTLRPWERARLVRPAAVSPARSSVGWSMASVVHEPRHYPRRLDSSRDRLPSRAISPPRPASRSAVAGDGDAPAELFGRYEKRAYNLCLRILGWRTTPRTPPRGQRYCAGCRSSRDATSPSAPTYSPPRAMPATT